MAERSAKVSASPLCETLPLQHEHSLKDHTSFYLTNYLILLLLFLSLYRRIFFLVQEEIVRDNDRPSYVRYIGSSSLIMSPRRLTRDRPGQEGPSYAPPPLPEGWIAQWDGMSRKYYFVQLSTGASQWDTPTHPAPTDPTPQATPQGGLEHPYGTPSGDAPADGDRSLTGDIGVRNPAEENRQEWS